MKESKVTDWTQTHSCEGEVSQFRTFHYLGEKMYVDG
jgi:hypothetical protein